MQEQQFGASSTVEDCSFLGFRPIMLYDTRVDTTAESLTLSRSTKQLPHFSTLSDRDLDEIDAERSSCVSSLDLQQSKTLSGPILQSQQYSPPPRSRERRFAVSDTMFNYRALGSLRSGLAPIALFSRCHAGLAVIAFASGAISAFVRVGYRPLLLSTVNRYFQRKYDAGTGLLDWADIVSVFLGLFSDCVPVYGTRRKAYIALGWIFSAVSYAIVCGIYLHQIRDVQEPDAIFGRLLEAWSIVGDFGLQISWVSALALVVGFGQREALSERGGLATLFLILWQIGRLAAHIIVAELQPRLSLSTTSAIIATVSVAVIPFVVCFVHDDDDQESAATLIASTKRVGVVPALRTGVNQMWEICQEKVTYRVLMFLLVYGALLKARDPDLCQALATWSGFAGADDNVHEVNPWVLAIESGVAVVALLHAKWRLLSTAWRPLALVGVGILVFGNLVQATIIATDAMRTKWFFSLVMGLIVWPQMWTLLFIVLATTEMTHVGCEGVTMGLVLSGQGLGTAVMKAIAEWINHATNSRLTGELIQEDSHRTRTRVMFAAIAYAGVQVFAAAAVLWLPRSKLETQQLRAFGGYSRKGAALIVVLYVALFAVVIVAISRIV